MVREAQFPHHRHLQQCTFPHSDPGFGGDYTVPVNLYSKLTSLGCHVRSSTEGALELNHDREVYDMVQLMHRTPP